MLHLYYIYTGPVSVSSPKIAIKKFFAFIKAGSNWAARFSLLRLEKLLSKKIGKTCPGNPVCTIQVNACFILFLFP
jgi:hypothetical protein